MGFVPLFPLLGVLQMNKMKKAALRLSALPMFVLAAASAKADAVDISAAVTAAKTDITTAGGLIIGVVVAVAAFSWIRRVIR
jgi:hypothetical protein